MRVLVGGILPVTKNRCWAKAKVLFFDLTGSICPLSGGVVVIPDNAIAQPSAINPRHGQCHALGKFLYRLPLCSTSKNRAARLALLCIRVGEPYTWAIPNITPQPQTSDPYPPSNPPQSIASANHFPYNPPASNGTAIPCPCLIKAGVAQ